MIALALDITIRQLSGDTRSLDDVMHRLWIEYGKPARGVPEGGVERIAAEVTGQPLDGFFTKYLYGTEDLPLKALLEYIGVEFVLRPAQSDDDKGGSAKKVSINNGSNKPRPDIGLRTVMDAQGVKVANVYSGGAAERAGIAAGDIIIAVDHLKVSKSNIAAALDQHNVGDLVSVHLFRRDELMVFDVCLQQAPRDRVALSLMDDIDPATAQRRENWMTSAA